MSVNIIHFELVALPLGILVADQGYSSRLGVDIFEHFWTVKKC